MTSCEESFDDMHVTFGMIYHETPYDMYAVHAFVATSTPEKIA